jgi:hypothetical protein
VAAAESALPNQAATLEHLDGTLAERFNTDKFSIK